MRFTDSPGRINLGMIDPRLKIDLWSVERVIFRKLDVENEQTARVWRVFLEHVNHSSEPRNDEPGVSQRETNGSNNHCLPLELSSVILMALL